MLKQYAIYELRPGMKLGREVYNDAGTTLADKGAVVDLAMIEGFDRWGIFTVMVEEPDSVATGLATEAKADPREEALNDPTYTKNYRIMLATLHTIYEKIALTFELDADAVRQMVYDPRFWELCQGRHAIIQLHNLEKTDDYIIHHSLNMGILAGLMGKWLKFSKERRVRLVMAALLNDCGMLQIPMSIRAKKGNLEHDELNLMRRHTVMASSMIKQSGLANEPEISDGVMQHHERNDGTGYPKNLKKAKISEFGRILALLDIYDAMASNRSYAKRNSPFEVFSQITDDILKNKLDTEYGILFIKEVCHSLIGAWGMLTNGEKAKIVYIDESRVNAKPMVQTAGGTFYDLNASDVQMDYLLTYEEATGGEEDDNGKEDDDGEEKDSGKEKEEKPKK